MTALPVRTLFDTPIHAATMADVLAACQAAIGARRRMQIGVVNVAKLVNMRKDALLRASITQADLVVADGMPVVWASRWLGRPLPERVAGIDLFERLLDLANEHAYGVFLLGARQDVLDEVARRIGERWPRARVVGTRHGYFRDEEQDAVADEIRRSGADMLFVAMSPPRKEIFLGRFGDALAVPVQHGVGGSFDVLAGRTKRAPGWMQRSGLEWAYRVWQEPGRMWKRYAVTNTAFCWMLFKEFFRRRPAGS